MVEFERVSSLQDILYIRRLLSEKYPEAGLGNSIEKSVDVIERRLREYYHDFFIVSISGNRVGAVASYDYRIYDNHCKTDVLFEGNNDDCALIIDRFTEYLFRMYPLNRIFTMQVNMDVIKAYKKCGYHTEAILKDYRFLSGRYTDVLYLAVDRKR